jgi:hypothetical protein
VPGVDEIRDSFTETLFSPLLENDEPDYVGFEASEVEAG